MKSVIAMQALARNPEVTTNSFNVTDKVVELTLDISLVVCSIAFDAVSCCVVDVAGFTSAGCSSTGFPTIEPISAGLTKLG